MKWEGMNQLCDVLRETSFAILKHHRNGHLEKIYENALAHRLRKQGPELQACQSVRDEHVAQLLGYPKIVTR